MFWIIQDNMFQESGQEDLINTLERMEIPYTVVKVLPLSDHLPINERIIPEINPIGLTMVCGSVGLANIAKKAGWTPGSFYNENHDYRAWKEHYGEYLLNADAKVCRLANVEHIWDKFFIRPCADSKTFSGQVQTWKEFDDWKHRVIDLHETYTSLDADTIVSYSSVKYIYREARFFVVDGKITSQSTYKIGSRVNYQSEVPPEMYNFAEKMINIWQPARAFVIDIALTDEDYKIVEINCINSAGFYKIDVQRFVNAIESMEFK
jgi:hypothetical protein